MAASPEIKRKAIWLRLHGQSQEQVAEKLGYSAKTISRWEKQPVDNSGPWSAVREIAGDVETASPTEVKAVAYVLDGMSRAGMKRDWLTLREAKLCAAIHAVVPLMDGSEVYVLARVYLDGLLTDRQFSEQLIADVKRLAGSPNDEEPTFNLGTTDQSGEPLPPLLRQQVTGDTGMLDNPWRSLRDSNE